MLRQTRVCIGLAALLISLPTLAQNVIDPKVVELMNKMSTYIASLDSWKMTGSSSSDVQLDNGTIVEQRSTQSVWVDRPDRIRTSDQTATVNLELYLADGRLTIYRDDANYFGQVEATGSIDTAMNYVLDEFDIEAPLLDFIAKNVSDNMLTDVQSATYLGLSRVRGEDYHHLALQGAYADTQLWISTDDKPLPIRLVITSKLETGAPRYSTLLDWDLKPDIADSTFSFSPPPGATQIDVQQSTVSE